MTTGAYTAEEDAAIIAQYSTRTLLQIAADLGRDYSSLVEHTHHLVKAGRLSYADRFYGQPWTQEDVDYLNDHWGLLPDEQIARHLRRSVNACQDAACTRAGITRKDNFYTLNTTAAARVGCAKETMMLHCRRGYLSAWRTWGAGQYGSWRIPTSALTQFRRRRPSAHVSGIAAWWREQIVKRWKIPIRD